MSQLSASSWEERYLSGDTPWDLSGPTPEFQRLLREGVISAKGRALVPGGGRGHDAILLAKAGIEVDLVDFAPSALRTAQELAASEKVTLNAFCLDFFALPKLGYHQNSYDLLLEYTFFCAIDPSLRKEYVKAASALLKPKGLLLGLFFPLASDKPGPPFLVSKEEVKDLFQEKFEVSISEPKESVKPRAGREFLGIFRKK